MSGDELWYEYLKTVKPLRIAKPKPQKKTIPEEPADTSVALLIPAAPKLSIHQLKELKAGDMAGVDKNLRHKMDAGMLKIEGVLDMHGYSREEAFRLLKSFINDAYAQGKRMLLVITGKGYKSEYNVSVLKQELPHWLNDPEIREKILRFSTAKQKHGGGGAVYILLKRVRIK